MTIEIKGWIHTQKGYDGKPRYMFWPHEGMIGYVKVCPHTLSFDLPENFDPTAGFIAALEERRDEVTREFRESVARINEEISKLQAIEYTPEVVTHG